MSAAIYVRVSTLDQNVENQLHELKQYVQHRDWGQPTIYEDRGVSGSKDRRPALDDLLKAARRRDIDVVVCWRLDRLGRSLRHLLDVLQELQALGVGFISLNEGLDATTPAGRLQMPAGCLRGVRARPDSGAGPRRAGPGPPTRQAARATATPDYPA